MHRQIDHDYVASLETELGKMLMFRNELPLSIELVSRAIESWRYELSSASIDVSAGGLRQQQNLRESSSEETASDCERVLQFIPIKKPADESSSEKQHDLPKIIDERSDWLRSVQLWNQTTDLPNESEELPEKQLVDDVATKSKFAEKRTSPESCSTESKKSEKEDKEGCSQRKKRRCWSQDLHRRFLHSLQQLGGAPVATPKQIMELMKVDGLTNDEVKSHLQKYRLHTGRSSPPQLSQNNGSNTQPPRFVILGAGLWAPAAPSQPQPWHEQLNLKTTRQVQD